MVAFSSLTPDQQSQVLAFVDQLFRPTDGETARAFARVQHMIDAANSGISALLQSLDQTAPLPNTSGLAGAAPLAPADVISGLNNYVSAAASFNTDPMRQARIKSAGIANTQL